MSTPKYISRIDAGQQMLLAVDNRQHQLIKEALEFGADPDFTRTEITALMMAVEMEDEESVKILLSFNARTDLPNGSGLLPLHRACEKTNPNLIKVIMSSMKENAVKIRGKDLRGNSAVVYAIRKDHVPSVSAYHEMLKGVDEHPLKNINSYNDNAVTVAVRNRSINVLKWALANGYSPDEENLYQETARSISTQWKEAEELFSTVSINHSINKPKVEQEEFIAKDDLVSVSIETSNQTPALLTGIKKRR